MQAGRFAILLTALIEKRISVRTMVRSGPAERFDAESRAPWQKLSIRRYLQTQRPLRLRGGGRVETPKLLRHPPARAGPLRLRGGGRVETIHTWGSSRAPEVPSAPAAEGG